MSLSPTKIASMPNPHPAGVANVHPRGVDYRLRRLSKAAFLTLLTLLLLLGINKQALAQAVLNIEGYTYYTHFTAGEQVTFKVTVKNVGDAAGLINSYLNVVLTNQTTGAEVAPYPASAALGANLAVGETANLEATWTTVAGRYSVTLIVYSGADAELDREYGAWPVHVGSSASTETLSAFPTIVDFGILPSGRYMHPVPIQVTWDFFLYNRLRHDKPWFMRMYTDNSTRYKGIPNAIYHGSPAGLVSADGHYTIPLKVWCLNYPPEEQEMGWSGTLSGPPPVDDDAYWRGPMLDDGTRYESKVSWARIPDYSEMTSDRGTWRVLIGQDQYDEQYATDTNPTGDLTLDSPFSTYLALETSPTAVKGNYSCELIVELYSP